MVIQCFPKFLKLASLNFRPCLKSVLQKQLWVQFSVFLKRFKIENRMSAAKKIRNLSQAEHKHNTEGIKNSMYPFNQTPKA